MIYTVKEYLDLLYENELISYCDVKEELLGKKIETLNYNSKENLNNGIFIGKGVNFKPEYLEEALSKQATLIVRLDKLNIKGKEKSIKGKEVIVNNIERAMAIISNKFFNFEAINLNIIAVTGTKGKSTTVLYIKEILDTFLKTKESGVISGIKNYFGEEIVMNRLTTPISLDVYKYLKKSSEHNLEYVTMEVSSQGLKYDRVAGISFEVGCFSNFGEDHIGDVEHEDIEDYLNSKKKLFEFSKKAVINFDIPEKAELIEYAMEQDINEEIITYGCNPEADVYGFEIKNKGEGQSFKVKENGKVEEVYLSMRGSFNISNALCAIAACRSQGIPFYVIKDALSKVKVKGRMEHFYNKDGWLIIDDYAHNEISFKALFDFVKNDYPEKRIISIIGGTADRAFLRRTPMGQIVGRCSDFCFVTEDINGAEPFEDVIKDIVGGIESVNGEYRVIQDRVEAFFEAMKIMDENSVLLLCVDYADVEKMIREYDIN